MKLLFMNSTIFSRIELKIFKRAKITLLAEDYEIEITQTKKELNLSSQMFLMLG